MYILNVTKAIKKMTVKKCKDLVFENYYQRMGFSTEDSYYSMKYQKKKDLQLFATKLTEKEYLTLIMLKKTESFLRQKNTKLEKISKIITHQPKSIESPNVVDIKSASIETPRTSHKLSKTIRQGQVVDAGRNSINLLYSDTTKCEIFWTKKNEKLTKTSHVYKGCASSYNIDILNSFNPEVQLKDDTEYAVI